MRLTAKGFVPLVAIAAVVLAACGGGDEEAASPTPAATPAATPTPVSGPSGIIGANPDFSLAAMIWQGYWLSRDIFGPVVMQSGMGVTFAPDPQVIQGAMQMVAQNPADGIVIPKNMAPLQAIYASADPSLTKDIRQLPPDDFSAFRFDPESFDKRITVAAMAQTMLKESQWARNFANDHFGALDGDFGAQQRFIGMMVNMLAQMQGRFSLENLRADDGLFHDSDSTLDYKANWYMLHVLSDIAGIVGDPGSRYHNPDTAAQWQ
ncbi:MAG: hypothetical protein ACE5IZ_05215, partial [Dehalococcoidia bacterium]